MTKLWLRGGDSREAPLEYQRAVAEFARSHGGQTAEIVWLANDVNCWQVKLYLRGDDPRRTPDPGTHFEPVLLHEWVDLRESPDHPKREKLKGRFAGYVSLELEEIGVTRLITILEQGSLLSGRGEFKSAEQALNVSLRKTQEQSEGRMLTAKDQALSRWRDKRRQALKIPFLPVGIELRKDRAQEQK